MRVRVVGPCLSSTSTSPTNGRRSGPDWTRAKHRRQGGAVARLVRYADDFVVMVAGKRDDAEALRAEVSSVLAPIGLRLSGAKNESPLDRRGLRLPGLADPAPRLARSSRQTSGLYLPVENALNAILDKVRTLSRREQHRTLADLLRRLNPVLRGWCAYFHHGVSSRTFQYLDHYAFWRVVGWIRKRHHGLNWGTIRRRYLPGWEIRDGDSAPYRTRKVAIVRYRYRGARIDTSWASAA